MRSKNNNNIRVRYFIFLRDKIFTSVLNKKLRTRRQKKKKNNNSKHIVILENDCTGGNSENLIERKCSESRKKNHRVKMSTILIVSQQWRINDCFILSRKLGTRSIFQQLNREFRLRNRLYPMSPIRVLTSSSITFLRRPPV